MQGSLRDRKWTLNYTFPSYKFSVVTVIECRVLIPQRYISRSDLKGSYTQRHDIIITYTFKCNTDTRCKCYIYFYFLFLLRVFQMILNFTILNTGGESNCSWATETWYLIGLGTTGAHCRDSCGRTARDRCTFNNGKNDPGPLFHIPRSVRKFMITYRYSFPWTYNYYTPSIFTLFLFDRVIRPLDYHDDYRCLHDVIDRT